MSRAQFWRVCHTNLSAVDLVICGCWLRVGLVCCSVYDMWGRAENCLILGCVPPYLLGYSVCRFIFHSPSSSPSFSADDGDTRRTARRGFWRRLARRGLRRRLATRRFRGRRGLRGGDAAPIGEFARELDLLSVPVVWWCASSDFVWFCFVSLPFACCRHVRPGSRVSFSGEVSLISIDLVHSTTFFVCRSADPVFFVVFPFHPFCRRRGFISRVRCHCWWVYFPPTIHLPLRSVLIIDGRVFVVSDPIWCGKCYGRFLSDLHVDGIIRLSCTVFVIIIGFI
jgi:hypothetical protein